MLVRPAVAWLLYLIAIGVLGKLARAVDLAQSTGSLEPLVALPLCLGWELVIAGAGALVMAQAGRLPARIYGVFATIIGLLLAVWHTGDFISYHLTGAPITWLRLQGNEGATLKDIGLLSAKEFAVIGAGLLISGGLLWGCHLGAARLGDRASKLAWVGGPGLVVLGGLLVIAQPALVDDHGLAEHPAVALLQTWQEARGRAAEKTGKGLSTAEWRALQRPVTAVRELPTPPPRHKSATPPSNLVLFIGEGIPTKHTSFGELAGADGPTPHLWRRAVDHGVLLSRFHTPYHSSIQALYAMVCAAYPAQYNRVTELNPEIDCGELSEVFAAAGKQVALVHGGHFTYYDKLSLLGGRGYEHLADAASIQLRDPKLRLSKWGVDDRGMVQEALAWLDTLERHQPFVLVLLPIAAHYPYDTPADFPRRFKGKGKIGKFRDNVAFLDGAFEQLMKGLEKRGLYRETLVAWTADHGETVDEPLRKTVGRRTAYQPSLHVPLVLLNERLFGRATSLRSSTRPGSHVDLLPTLMDALGLPPNSRHMGQSLLGEGYEERRIFFAAHPVPLVGFIERERKFIYGIRSRKSEYYDLRADPGEKRDLSADFPKRMKRFAQIATRFLKAARAHVVEAPSLARGDLHWGLLQRGAVTVSMPSQASPTRCEQLPDGGGFRCPGLAAKAAAEAWGKVHGQKGERGCLALRAPAGGEVTLTIEDPRLYQRISGVRMFRPEKWQRAKVDRDARLQVLTDGEVSVDRALPTGKRLTTFGIGRPRDALGLRVKASKARPAQVCLFVANVALTSTRKQRQQWHQRSQQAR